MPQATDENARVELIFDPEKGLIINRSSKTNIGELMLKYGGGGHSTAGTCQIEHDKCEDILKELFLTQSFS